ncbi:alginate export family protein [PVC group bacterium]|nr:alginate export family protein [PVC group bacterium]
MKKLAILGALVLVVAMCSAAYAEVQNVKVGGDIRTAYRLRNNYDLDRANASGTPSLNAIQGDTDQWIETRARIYVQADLTDNVRAMIRIIADFVWGIDVASNNVDGVSNVGGSSALDRDGEDYNVEIDLAWVEISEFWFSYLTMIIGRQELHYGNEFIIGDNVGNASDTDSDELDRKLAFNATRYILDFDPLTIDIVFAMIEEERMSIGLSGEDEWIIGTNVNYIFSNDWIGEAYVWYQNRGNVGFATGANSEFNELTSRLGDGGSAGNNNNQESSFDRQIVTLGVRAEGSIYPIDENLYFNGEIAYQVGDWNDDAVAQIGPVGGIVYRNDDQSALAAQVSLDYTWDNPYQPNFGLQYTFYEGHEFNDVTGKHNGWDPMYEHQTQGIIYDNIAGGPNMGAASNGHIINAFFSFMPTEVLTIAVDYYHFWLDEPLSNDVARLYQTDTGLYYAYTDDEDMGDEIDVVLIYDYTEDVQFQWRGAAYFPGSAVASGLGDSNNDEAYYFEYSVNVAF